MAYGPFDAERINTKVVQVTIAVEIATQNILRRRSRAPFGWKRVRNVVTPLATCSTNSGMRRRQKDIRPATIHALVVSQF
jgi:hypothetical protein